MGADFSEALVDASRSTTSDPQNSALVEVVLRSAYAAVVISSGSASMDLKHKCIEAVAASECSTSSDAEDSESNPESPEPFAHVQQAPFTDTGTVIIFDFDDTLLASSWIRTVDHRSEEDVARHAELVEAVLRAACAVAHVAIVTMAQRPWVHFSAERYLPGLDLPSLLEELGIGVYYATEEAECCPGALEANDCAALKTSSMAQSLDDMCSAGLFGDEPPSSVISIGDSEAERQALTELLLSVSGDDVSERPWCKTVKFVERPTLEALGDELRQLLPLLPNMAKIQKDFDLCICSPYELAAKARIAGL